jgi:hypothetical protein
MERNACRRAPRVCTWTDDGLDILSFAWRSDQNLPALFEAWQKGVGPDE